MVEQLSNQTAGGGSIPTPSLQKSPRVKIISLKKANELLKHHYLGAVRTAQLCFGHEEGCTVWGVPRSISVQKRMRDAGFEPIELVRMVGIPGHLWATSSLLAHSMRLLFKTSNFDSAITYADREVGHTGNTYLAANWLQVEDAQPDGSTWWLDGKRVSRKRFFNEFGTTKYEIVKTKYGKRLVVTPDIPKKRFIFLKEWTRVDAAQKALKKEKTWGAKRLLEFETKQGAFAVLSVKEKAKQQEQYAAKILEQSKKWRKSV